MFRISNPSSPIHNPHGRCRLFPRLLVPPCHYHCHCCCHCRCHCCCRCRFQPCPCDRPLLVPTSGINSAPALPTPSLCHPPTPLTPLTPAAPRRTAELQALLPPHRPSGEYQIRGPASAHQPGSSPRTRRVRGLVRRKTEYGPAQPRGVLWRWYRRGWSGNETWCRCRDRSRSRSRSRDVWEEWAGSD